MSVVIIIVDHFRDKRGNFNIALYIYIYNITIVRYY